MVKARKKNAPAPRVSEIRPAESLGPSAYISVPQNALTELAEEEGGEDKQQNYHPVGVGGLGALSSPEEIDTAVEAKACYWSNIKRDDAENVSMPLPMLVLVSLPSLSHSCVSLCLCVSPRRC